MSVTCCLCDRPIPAGAAHGIDEDGRAVCMACVPTTDLPIRLVEASAPRDVQ